MNKSLFLRNAMLVIAFVFGIVTTPSWALKQPAPRSLAECQQYIPWGAPNTSNLLPICRRGYLSAYDATAKIPQWVAWTVTPQSAVGCLPRVDAFAADKSIKNSPTPDDYANTGYDRGHMAPDADLSLDPISKIESFLMTNMTPQAPSLNRGIWKLLETATRAWALETNSKYIVYTGAVYSSQSKRITNGVIVPDAYYKILINVTRNTVTGWWFPHKEPYANLGTNLPQYRMKVSDIQSRSGVIFKYPENVVELRPGSEPSVNFGNLTKTKRQTCKKQ